MRVDRGRKRDVLYNKQCRERKQVQREARIHRRAASPREEM